MELLRICAMLMIVAYHIYIHYITCQLTDLQSIQERGNGWFCTPNFSKRLCILALIAPWGQIGNAIFLIISGYFMSSKDVIDLTKISKKLLFQLGFAACVLGLVSIYTSITNITGLSIRVVPFSCFNSGSWYIGYYFFVIVLGKAFLNKILKGLSQKNYLMLLAALFALLQFTWSVSVISNLGGGLETLCTGVFLYSLGGYIKEYNPFEKIKLWGVIAVIIAMDVIVIGNFYLTTASNILNFNPEGEDTFVQSIPSYTNNQIIPLIIGIAMFELFRRIKMPNFKVLNFVGASTFMVYLIHDNELFYDIWNTQDWITLICKNVALFVQRYLIWILGTFGVGVLLYCLFIILEKVIIICKPLVIRK